MKVLVKKCQHVTWFAQEMSKRAEILREYRGWVSQLLGIIE